MLKESIKYVKNWTGATRPPREGSSGLVLLIPPLCIGQILYVSQRTAHVWQHLGAVGRLGRDAPGYSWGSCHLVVVTPALAKTCMPTVA